MSLEKLKALESEAKNLEYQKTKHESAEKLLANARNGQETLAEFFGRIRDNWRYGDNELARDALTEVINEAKLDILRLAELRLAAKARELKIEAARRNAIVTASILPIPEITVKL